MPKKIFFLLLLYFSCIFVTRADKVSVPVAGTDYGFNLADGSIIPKTTDGKSNLDYGIFRLFVGPSNTYRWNDAQHGMEFKVGNYIEIDVAGSVTLKIGGCQYSASASKITVSDKNGAYTLTKNSKTKSCSETLDFVYSGAATTLKIEFKENKTYVPYINIIAPKTGSAVETPESNVIYDFNLSDGSIIPTNTTGKTAINSGLFSLVAGNSNAYGYNGTTHGSILKTGNSISLKVAGNSKIRFGGCQYSNGTIAATSATGNFDKASQSSKTAKCYHQDNTTVDFIYAGGAGTVTFNFTGTNYIPNIQILPIPYDFELTPWVKKSGKIMLNGVGINITAGENATSSPAITLEKGTIISATPEIASIRINLEGKILGTTAIVTYADVECAWVLYDTLFIRYNDKNTKPYNYKFLVADDSKVYNAEPGKSYSYDFANGSTLPQTSYSSLRYSTFITSDGLMTINSNTTTTSKQFGFHDTAHGLVCFPGNSFDIKVAGNATITFGTCQYGSAKDAVFEFTNSEGKVLGTCTAQNIGTGACGTGSFSYFGGAGIITATLKSTEFPTAEIYIHSVSIENAAKVIKTSKTDVWDFGAAILDTALYNNNLTVASINAWYDASIAVASSGNVLPKTFTSGVLNWVGGSNDRLRTSNTNLTRYDANGTGIIGKDTLNGSLYVNGSAATSRYIGLTLSEDDEVVVYAKSQNGSGKLNFQYVPVPADQTNIADLNSTGVVTKFVAKYAGSYHIFDSADKPSYFRITRKDAIYATVSCAMDLVSASGIPENYKVVFTNEAGKSWSSTLTNGAQRLKVPANYMYKLSLANANGFIISSSVDISVSSDTSVSVKIQKVQLVTLNGSITGLGNNLSKLGLTFKPVPSPRIFVPKPVIDALKGTYSVQIEPNILYAVFNTGVNDFALTNDTLAITKDATIDLSFVEKPKYDITLNGIGLTTEQKSKLVTTFTNLNESGYSYTFTGTTGIKLRNGVYSLYCAGLDDYPLTLGATSNLKVNGASVSKNIEFKACTFWPFDDETITNGTTLSYKGLLFNGNVYNEKAKSHLVAKSGATIKVPMNPGEKLTITYYYSADFSIENGAAITSSSGSTSTYETTSYSYTGNTSGYATITNGSGTTYFTDMVINKTMPYTATITVGKNKTYQSINDALNAVRSMVRPNDERVKIMIDPGNYEEMLTIDVKNVSLVNSSVNPSIALANKGVDINVNAVRITSYYGHGYNYYSMGTDQKWSSDALRVNKENGYTTYSNTGSGTTNNSYWNATVLVSASGFEAKNVIFENSYNQYVSKKESEDVVIEWTSGGKGTRPKDVGNTAVQGRSFVERAAAIAFTKSGDKALLDNCRVVGRQDSFYGAEGARVVAYKGVLMGACDYIFGGMTLVAYKSDLSMNISDHKDDVAYITAAQQTSARGYLMYECKVTSAVPDIETASAYKAKPGYFGRPWQGVTSEVVYYNTTIEQSLNNAYENKSLITPLAWLNTLGGASDKCYEYGTIELSGENNQSARATWSHVLTTPKLNDGTDITCFNFTKGSDNWDPIKDLISNGGLTSPNTISDLDNGSNIGKAIVAVNGKMVSVFGINDDATISIYNLNGSVAKTLRVSGDTQFEMSEGLWLVRISSPEGNQMAKIIVK
jgi:pectin methylesterase-like acyl-CoA thioesterase